MWRVEKVSILEERAEYGGLHVVGLISTRHCGCAARVGIRLDRNEITFGACGCEQHGIHVERALDVFKHMPPQDAPALELWESLLEREIAAVPA